MRNDWSASGSLANVAESGVNEFIIIQVEIDCGLFALPRSWQAGTLALQSNVNFSHL
jgi:hypothetical protein